MSHLSRQCFLPQSIEYLSLQILEPEFDFHVKLKEDKVLHPQCLVSKLTGANPSARSPQREIPGFGSGVLGRLLWFIGVRGWGL